MINWLTIELSSRCNKDCSFCGRAKARKEKTLELGDMDIGLYRYIVMQYEGDIIQFSKDGDPLLYNDLDKVARLSKNFITNIVTNGILLWEKAEIVSKFTSVCVSVIEDDEEQFNNVQRFVEKYETPVVIKFLGDYDNPEYKKLGLTTTRRSIHHPKGDFKYKGSAPVIPELGICMEFLNKPSIDWQGNFYICNRYDPEGKGIIGDCKMESLEEIWNGELRQVWLRLHKKGKRDLIPICSTCKYWGFPAGG